MTEMDDTLLIQGGTLVIPDESIEGDLLVRGEKIQAIGKDLAAPGDATVIDAVGCYVLPGVIDAHTHIQLDTGVYQTSDDWFTGTRAAACGGVTTVLDFATQFPGQSIEAAVEARLIEAQDAVIDYGLHVMVTDLPPGREGELARLPALGTPSLKLYTTYRPNYYADDATILRLMETCAQHGILPLIHCENDAIVTAQTEALVAAGDTGWRHHGRSRPALSEQEAIRRVLFLAEVAGSRIHICHCSTTLSVALVAKARDGGQRATCETCPQYLLLDHTAYEDAEPWRYILQPPLRPPGEPNRLWSLVESNAVDMIVTDHCDYTREQKTAQDDFTRTPGGLPGLETLLTLSFTYGVAQRGLTLPQLVTLLSANPARLWGMWPRKGGLIPGADADVVIYDPRPKGTITAQALHHQAGYTPYEGWRVHGQVKTTIARGEIIYDGGNFTGRRGRGQFIKRSI
ncbi:MAG TPA: dihydropyrimidinase [Chloroflexi bacterium]|nr:dihydropyrimidinase [Chloroflexota bacterium]